MNMKLSALALGITLAYGIAAAHAADVATIYQSGYVNDASIEQTRSNANASISTTGAFNDAVIYQEEVQNSAATIYQAADAGDATINQGNTWVATWHGNGYWADGYNQTATINQTGGWGNTAWTTQTGSNVEATINQNGVKNIAGIVQAGNGYSMDVAVINQSGSFNDGYINQAGRNLDATINQSGRSQEAVILQTGSYKTATITQASGYGNSAYINQR